jgi:hypothetical protein
MLEADTTQPVPSTSELIRFWKETDFSVSTRSYPTTLEYVKALQQRYENGRVLFASFEVAAEKLFDWYVSRNDLRGLLFFHKFWHTPTPGQVLSELIHASSGPIVLLLPVRLPRDFITVAHITSLPEAELKKCNLPSAQHVS